MTDTRLPDRWLTDPVMDGLSDRAWRTFTGSLMFSNGAGTDGAIVRRSLRLLHPDGVDLATTDELVAVGLWERTSDGVQVQQWSKTQSLAAAVERQREQNRQKVRRHRQSKKQAVDDAGADTGDVTGYETGELVGQDRTGQDRTGKDRETTPRQRSGKPHRSPPLSKISPSRPSGATAPSATEPYPRAPPPTSTSAPSRTLTTSAPDTLTPRRPTMIDPLPHTTPTRSSDRTAAVRAETLDAVGFFARQYPSTATRCASCS